MRKYPMSGALTQATFDDISATVCEVTVTYSDTGITEVMHVGMADATAVENLLAAANVADAEKLLYLIFNPN